MSELGKVRLRIERASNHLKTLDGVVLTTFNLGTAFLEEHALPAVLGVEAETTAARRAELHMRLGGVPCTVFYDPAVAPRITGRYRYVARPVPVPGRFFHPKLVVLAGRDEVGTKWVYLAASSANLTLSGWGRNAESFGETWIHTRGQQSWHALDQFLSWLQAHAPLDEQAETDAVSRVREALDRMPDRRRFADDRTAPWSGTLYADFYTSMVHRKGLPAFLQMGRTRRPKSLWAYSPYWSDVAASVGRFNAQETVLVPALRADGSALGLSQQQARELEKRVTVQRNPNDNGTRFWHMKAYWIKYGSTVFTAVGSCNFTSAGLSGGDGNVEAMLVFEANPEWLPEGEAPELDEYATDAQPEEDVPQPSPVAIVVAWDWRDSTWRWWLEAGSRQRNFTLTLPGLAAFRIVSGTGAKPGKPPPRGASFYVGYATPKGERRWKGQVVELNLDYCSRTFGRSLNANEILDSWRGQAPTWDIGGSGGTDDAGDSDDEIEHETPAAFDAVNLYDLYRSMRALRIKLSNLDKHPDIQRAYLVGRPDSVMALAHLADQGVTAPVVRYLVLRELSRTLSNWKNLLDRNLVAYVSEMANRARVRTHNMLIRELDSDTDKADAMLDWFEEKLAALDRGMVS